MIRRIAAAVATFVVATAVLSGCIGQPAPAESTPLFSSEDEAFAAAEQTYRNYVDALNQVDLSDPSTFEPVYAWTTGDANANERKTLTQMSADKWTVKGASIPTLVQPRSMGGTNFESAELAVCVNVADVDVLDASGESVVSPDRGDTQSTVVGLVRGDSPTEWLVSSIEGREGEPVCES
ncbi:hypothetical protein [Microbacterium sp. P02]|uniref:hypothetical protein n=1 Tax=Microbacterium sp. P02 TaxID=3366260 RepID=UPI00366D2AF1